MVIFHGYVSHNQMVGDFLSSMAILGGISWKNITLQLLQLLIRPIDGFLLSLAVDNTITPTHDNTFFGLNSMNIPQYVPFAINPINPAVFGTANPHRFSDVFRWKTPRVPDATSPTCSPRWGALSSWHPPDPSRRLGPAVFVWPWRFLIVKELVISIVIITPT